MRFTVTVTPDSEELMDSDQVSTRQLNSLTIKMHCGFHYCLQDIISHTVPWRIQEYEDLTIVEGERVIFTWQGFHSLHQVSKIPANYDDCDVYHWWQVTEDVYQSCDAAASSLYVWGEPSVDNSATIDGLVPGSYYFLCSIAGHCDAGMKIKVQCPD